MSIIHLLFNDFTLVTNCIVMISVIFFLFATYFFKAFIFLIAGDKK
jgi:hypothetical protein